LENDPETVAEVHNFLEALCQMSMLINQPTFSKVEEEIKKLNRKKSPGYDKICAITIRNLPPKCIRLLTHIYNAMLRLEYFPSQWKCAEIIMIAKPNKPENCTSSYRPISLLGNFSKVFERILLRRMLPALDELNIISELQFGFRRIEYSMFANMTNFQVSTLLTLEFHKGVL